jgi:group I intron endonuclease
MVGIYKITSPSGKVYIGQSWNIAKRKGVYKRIDCKDQVKIYNSLVKYGWEAHSFEIIHELSGDVLQQDLDKWETYYWSKCKAEGLDLLNLREPGMGGKFSEETKKKMSLSMVGNSNAKGYRHTEETKNLISKANVGRVKPEEVRRRLSESYKGKSKSDETKKKMSLAKSGIKYKVLECPHCGKCGGINNMKRFHFDNCITITGVSRGKKPTEGTRRKMSEAKVGKARPKVTCPHCGKVGGAPNMKRYRFDRCSSFENKVTE